MKAHRVERKHVDLSRPRNVVPLEFGFEGEHPSVSPPFTLRVYGQEFIGRSLSLTTIEVETQDEVFLIEGTRHAVTLQFAFENFSVSIYPDVVVVGERGNALRLKFANPTGDHVAQLRFVLNSFIAGDFVTMGSLMSYSGPTKPKEEEKAQDQKWTQRYVSIAVAAVSCLLALWAATALYVRQTTSYEMHPVLIERAGQPMKATTAGQVAYLNPTAEQGEVLFSVNANSGDVLNFRKPCSCEAIVNQGVMEGVTVLPDDVIMTILTDNVGLNIHALMSIEGLARAMKGDRVFLDLTDGRSIPVSVVARQSANTASLRGDLFVPVQLQPPSGALSEADIGGFAQLRVTKAMPWSRGP